MSLKNDGVCLLWQQHEPELENLHAVHTVISRGVHLPEVALHKTETHRASVSYTFS